MVDIIKGFFEWIGKLVTDAIGLLPTCPFAEIDLSGFVSVMGYINYFIPVGRMFSTATLWASALLIWYCIQWGFRWANVID